MLENIIVTTYLLVNFIYSSNNIISRTYLLLQIEHLLEKL